MWIIPAGLRRIMSKNLENFFKIIFQKPPQIRINTGKKFFEILLDHVKMRLCSVCHCHGMCQPSWFVENLTYPVAVVYDKGTNKQAAAENRREKEGKQNGRRL